MYEILTIKSNTFRLSSKGKRYYIWRHHVTVVGHSMVWVPLGERVGWGVLQGGRVVIYSLLPHIVTERSNYTQHFK